LRGPGAFSVGIFALERYSFFEKINVFSMFGSASILCGSGTGVGSYNFRECGSGTGFGANLFRECRSGSSVEYEFGSRSKVNR
jgi:hypothetical protein